MYCIVLNLFHIFAIPYSGYWQVMCVSLHKTIHAEYLKPKP